MSSLLDAVAEQDYDKAKLLLDGGADVNAELEGQWVTVLDRAAYYDDYKMVKLLIDHGVNLDTPVRSGTGMTVFQNVVYHEYEELVRLMIDAGADVNAPAGGSTGGSTGRTALQTAVLEHNMVLVKLLLDSGADINAPGSRIRGPAALWPAVSSRGRHFSIWEGVGINRPVVELPGCTALQAATQSGHKSIVKLLIDAGADVNAPGSDTGGSTALQAAAGSRDMALVKFLVERGADINAPAEEQSGRTALQAAAEHGDAPLVEFLINSKANVNAPAARHDGRTALQAAAERGYEKVVKLLLSKGALPNAPAGEINGKTALRAAIDLRNRFAGMDTVDERRDRKLRMVKLLLGGGAVGHETKDSEGRNALHTVCLAGTEGFDPRILEILLPTSTPRALNAKDFSGSTPLHCAVRRANLIAVSYLIQKNANLEIKDNSGRTVLQIAFLSIGDVAPIPFADTDTDADAEAAVVPVAVAKTYSDIAVCLLKSGARTDGLLLEDLPTLWRLVGDGLLVEDLRQNIVILSDDMTQGTTVAIDPKIVTDPDDPVDSPSIYFCR